MPEENQKTILLVENDSFLAKLTMEKFVDNGYKVIHTNNGAEAFDLIIKKQPDIILSEVLLPKLDGFDLLMKIKKSKKNISHIPFIFFTGLGQVADLEKGKNVGADDYIIKSHTSLDDVVKRVNKILLNV